jgi:hypothetical protein
MYGSWFDWGLILQEMGPIAGVIVFFIWRDWKRESRLVERVEKLEDYQKETLAHLVEKGIAALTQSSEIIKWVGRMNERVPSECPYFGPPSQEVPRSME